MVYTWQPPEISDKGFQWFPIVFILLHKGKNMENPSRIKIWAQLSPQTLMIPKLERFPGMIPPKPFYARIWMCAYIYIYMWYYVILYAIKSSFTDIRSGSELAKLFRCPSSVGRNCSLTVRWLGVQHIVTHQILYLRRADDQQNWALRIHLGKNGGIPTTIEIGGCTIFRETQTSDIRFINQQWGYPEYRADVLGMITRTG